MGTGLLISVVLLGVFSQTPDPVLENEISYQIVEERINATPEPTPTPLRQDFAGQAPKPVVKKQQPSIPTSDVAQMIIKYAQMYNVNPSIMLSIAQCESGLRANATNGSFGGIFQFLASTWISNRRAMGLPTDADLRFNAEEAARTAAFKMSRDGFGAWPACSKKALASLE